MRLRSGTVFGRPAEERPVEMELVAPAAVGQRRRVPRYHLRANKRGKPVFARDALQPNAGRP